MTSTIVGLPNCDLEIDISDSELAEIMPRVSPSQLISPLPFPMSSGILTTAVLSNPETPKIDSITSASSVTIAKKPRKQRVSKKTLVANSDLVELANDVPSTPSTMSPDNKKKSGSNKATPLKSVGEQEFTLSLTKECFTTEELSINPLTQIFIENSRVTNNELIKYQAVRTGILDYKCYGKGCPTKDGNWRRRLGFLILVRNNNRDSDLRMTNLSLLCPNCYCQDKGVMAFEKMKKEIVRTCTFCGTVLDTKYNSDKCGRCAWQIKNKIQKSANIDRLSRAYGTEVEGLSASNMALLMNSSILDEGTSGSGTYNSSSSAYSGSAVSSISSSARLMPRQTVNPNALRIDNSTSLKRLFMELSEQI